MIGHKVPNTAQVSRCPSMMKASAATNAGVVAPIACIRAGLQHENLDNYHVDCSI